MFSGVTAESLLIVSGTDTGIEYIKDFLANSYNVLNTAKSGSEARRLLLLHEYEMLVISMPLPDEPGFDLAITAAEKDSGVIVLVRSEHCDEVTGRLEEYGVMTLAKSSAKQMLRQVFGMSLAGQRRLASVKRENAKLRARLEETRLVSRAKCVIVQNMKMTENEAHKFIEKQAMDNRMTRSEIAERIIRTYDA